MLQGEDVSMALWVQVSAQDLLSYCSVPFLEGGRDGRREGGRFWAFAVLVHLHIEPFFFINNNVIHHQSST